MASFVPNPNFDRENSNPKDWAYHLGCLPQKHHIVFTKEDFVNFLKQHNVHVGPNFTELSKLPKYATIGKLTESANGTSATAAPAPVQQDAAASSSSSMQPIYETEEASAAKNGGNVVYTSSGEVFRPSRKVRQLPGGGSAQVTALFGGADEVDEQPAPAASRRAAPAAAPIQQQKEEFEPLGSAPARRVSGNIPQQQHVQDFYAEPTDKPGIYEGVRNDAVMNNGFRPTRRVRVPGGTGGLSSISFD
ncbi:hypothetical protein BCV70DRAFT_1276 [Testicularia cyperi]|uniref:Uncharacterized protein n=1 Tax=Testicularia cyperi TaxID=1882483 RepID=A0A317XX42_9BASI|nr:hypothetical protein BCV70DRAFT_1276 [Testicularia cyperi]